MNIKKQKTPIDLTDTTFESIFITDYMPAADGVNVKVYLLGYKYATDRNTKFDNKAIATTLGITMEKVNEAWRYWESIGLIHFLPPNDKANNYAVEFVNLKQLYIDNIYKATTETSNNIIEEYDDLLDEPLQNIENEEDEELKAFTSITNKKTEMFDYMEKLMKKSLNTRDKSKLLDIMSRYDYDEAMLITLLNYALLLNKSNPIAVMVRQSKILHQQGVSNIESLENIVNIETNYKEIYEKIQKYFRKNSKLNEGITKIIDKWLFEYNYGEDIIFKCLDKSVNTLNPNFNYFNSIITNWYTSGCKTIEDIDEYEDNYKNNKYNYDKNVQNSSESQEKPRNASNFNGSTSTNNAKKQPHYNRSQSKNKFHNFEGNDNKYTNEELEDIAKKNLTNKLQKYDIPDYFEKENNDD